MIIFIFLIVLLIIIKDFLFKYIEYKLSNKLIKFNFNDTEIRLIIKYSTSILILLLTHFLKLYFNIHYNIFINIVGVLIGLIILIKIH